MYEGGLGRFVYMRAHSEPAIDESMTSESLSGGTEIDIVLCIVGKRIPYKGGAAALSDRCRPLRPLESISMVRGTIA